MPAELFIILRIFAHVMPRIMWPLPLTCWLWTVIALQVSCV